MIRSVTLDNLHLWSSFASQVWSTDELQLREQFILGKFPYEFLYYSEDKPLAWISLSLRKDYVEGCHTSPVAYIEGIMVCSQDRHKGIASQLIAFAEEWARSMGACQLASNADVENISSQQFHLQNGFREVCRTVHYVRDI